jgi:ribonuclease E
MSKLMLIDAAHPEETRVAIVNGGQVDDFDFETTGNEQLRGNIYLAKITRVEPSLQAAFVEYGGNRHGFLAFSEIHPDYYQLPAEDREALLKEAAEEAAAAIEDEDEDDDEGDHAHADSEDHDHDDDDDDDDDASDDEDDSDDEADDGETKAAAKPARGRRPARKESPRSSISKRYKIQEVIRRRQVLLVQVVKEERGNKGAALTTFLSLAGRYSVLMPNTPRGGGISRKIVNGADRKRLKSIVGELDVPDGMGLIVRTAGAKRTKTEIRRDYDYLSKLWETIVEKTLTSEAPMLINAEGGLVHRAMRDMFDKDIEEVWVQGEEAYREAKDLAKLIMPSQSKKVQQWKEDDPLFVAEAIEDQLDSIYSPVVQLKSGGYLVINQTEALVAIDVNSGKSTKERNIEQTAVRTNLEAAEEACRQMRLRDLAGLVVIDFIDMDENKNNRSVEKKMKDCLKVDRARVQHGRISQFGLMEISRQRRRQGVLQATSDPCEVCNGTGRRRSIPSAALQLIRAIEARASTGGLKSISVKAPTDVALYILNNKREALVETERMAGFAVSIHSSEDLLPGDFTIEAERDPGSKPKKKSPPRSLSKSARPIVSDEDDEDIDDEDDEIVADTDDEAEDKAEDSQGKPRKRRRRRGGRGRSRDGRDTGLEVVDGEASPVEVGTPSVNGDAEDDDEDDEDEAKGTSETQSDENEDGTRKRRRRGRRGGRRRRKPGGEDRAEGAEGDAPTDGGAYLDGLSASAPEMLDAEAPSEAKAEPAPGMTASEPEETAEPESVDAEAEAAPEKPKRARRSRAKPKPNADADAPVEAKAAPEAEPVAAASEPEPANAEPAREPAMAAAAPKPEPKPEPAKTEDTGTKRKGWWARARGE